jgi:hypothetical protein
MRLSSSPPSVVSFVALTLVLGGAAAGSTPWEVATSGPASLAVPKAWRNMDGLRPNMLLFRQGDGLRIPVQDDTGAPLQAGLVLEQLPAAMGSLRDVATDVIAAAKKDPRLQPSGTPTIESVKLVDATEAVFVTVVFVKEQSRRSLQMKLIARGADARTWMVSGFLVGGKDSRWCAPGSDLAKWLRAHIASLRLTPGSVDEKPLREAYLRYDRRSGEGSKSKP